MKELASLAVALMCLLPLVSSVHVGQPGFGDRSRVNRPDRHPVSTDPETQVIEHPGVVLGAGDQAVITDQGNTVTITRVPKEARKFAQAD